MTSKSILVCLYQTNAPHFSVSKKGLLMSNPKPYRSKDEWLALIQEARQSGMTDAGWCLSKGINRNAFYSAIKRLRKSACDIPSKKPQNIYDLTTPKQDVVRVDIVPDIPPLKEMPPKAEMYLDNSHMIEISFGDVHISLNNGADPVLVSKTLSILRSYT